MACSIYVSLIFVIWSLVLMCRFFLLSHVVFPLYFTISDLTSSDGVILGEDLGLARDLAEDSD